MPTRINRVARGLISLFGAKGSVQPPQMVSDQVVGNVDLLPFLVHGSMEEVTSLSTVVAAVPGFYGTAAGTDLLVPGNQMWFCYDFSVVAANALGAGTFAEVATAYRNNQGQDYLLGRNGPFAYTAGDLPAAESTKCPILLRPGDQLGMFLFRSTLGVAWQGRLTARFMRLDV